MNDTKLTYLLKNHPKPRIAILRALQIGDLLCTIPAIRSLKAALPDASISLIGLPWSKNFTERFNQYFDQFLEFPGFPGLPEQQFNPYTVLDFTKKMQIEQFDLVLQMQGNGYIVNPLVELFDAKLTAGFHEMGGYRPSHLFMPYPDDIHEIRRHLKLMQFLGCVPQGADLEFPISAREGIEFFDQSVNWQIKPGEYICIHAGSRSKERRWDLQNFAKVADFVARLGYKVVLTGSKDEKNLVKEVSSLISYPHLNLAGHTSLGVAAALIKHSRLLIANDTGVSHIACALRVPSVIIFSGSDPKRWAPLNTNLHTSVYKEQASVEEVIRQTSRKLGIMPIIRPIQYRGGLSA